MFFQLCKKIFIVTSASHQQKINFLMGPSLKRCILGIQWKRGSNIKKTHTTQTSPTTTEITEAKHKTTNPANSSKVTTRGTTTWDTNKKARNI